MLIKAKAIKELVKAKGKQISKEAIFLLDNEVNEMFEGVIANSPEHRIKTI